MVILTADHYIVDTAQFRSALAAAEQVARGGTIVTLGIKPTYPRPASAIFSSAQRRRSLKASGFIDPAASPRNLIYRRLCFLESGRYAWNSGMFIWRADRLLAEFRAQLPDAHAVLLRIGAALATPDTARVLAEAWPAICKVSISSASWSMP